MIRNKMGRPKKERTRKCPKCGKELTYTERGNYCRAVRNNSPCVNCKTMSEEFKKKISVYWTGKKKPNYERRDKSKLDAIWIRNCPECNKELKYIGRESAYLIAVKENRVCPSCITNKRKVKYILSKEQINKMAATKAGYSSWEEYQKALPEFKKYKLAVQKLTEKQPLHTLPNIEKRGRAGIEGAYQLDHIISIWRGFRENIPVEVIAHISNLQMLTWEENLQKHKGTSEVA